ncbi:MAG: hypothetical protein JO290_05670 [Sphingomonadaceae bacterium]|nr:hypothetical protein [Sphingomonadaceae bacterium]
MLRCNILVAIGAAAPVAAAEVSVAGDVLSDYRFRGVSLSDRQPVADGTLSGQAGPWFAGVEAISSSRGRYAVETRSAEVDLSAGWSRSFGLLTPSVGAIGYLHPGGEAANGEVFASLAGALGPATLTLAANYAPDQGAAPGGNLYLQARAAAAIPTTPLTLRAAVGREAGAFAGFRASGTGGVKTDWRAGVEARVLRVVVLGLDYVGNDLPRIAPGRLQKNREDGVVARVGVRF